ncbi:MAG: hypothetical protein ACKVP0_18045 [Pirellulaceae bacterium]
MSRKFDSLAEKIRSIGEVYCENQMYVWPGFDPKDPNPRRFFKKLGIEFDGDLFIRYPVKKTFSPIPGDQLDQQERSSGLKIPDDYRQLLQQFGPVHLPGKANIAINSLQEAIKTTRLFWCYEGTALSALAISSFNQTSDGNSIGFIRIGDSLQSEVYEFDHELVYQGKDPRLWTRKVGDSLADFLLKYLNEQSLR